MVFLLGLIILGGLSTIFLILLMKANKVIIGVLIMTLVFLPPFGLYSKKEVLDFFQGLVEADYSTPGTLLGLNDNILACVIVTILTILYVVSRDHKPR